MPTDKRTMLSRRRALGLAGMVGGAALLPGCSAVQLAGAPNTLYTLTPKSTFDPAIPTADWQLLVELPVAAAGLDTTRIALTENYLQLDYFAQAAWTERAPIMVQTLIVESFENSGRIISIGRETFGLRSDFVLKSELREFQADYVEGRRVRVGVNSKLVRNPQRAIIAGQTFEQVADVQGDGFIDVVRAFDEALGDVMRDLVAWTLIEGQNNWVAQPR